MTRRVKSKHGPYVSVDPCLCVTAASEFLEVDDIIKDLIGRDNLITTQWGWKLARRVFGKLVSDAYLQV